MILDEGDDRVEGSRVQIKDTWLEDLQQQPFEVSVV